jgi:hypothetical protein
MPKRPKAAAAEQQQQPEENQPLEENGLHVEDLDLSSSDEGEHADGEYSEGGSEEEPGSLSEDDAAEIQDALADYMAAAQAQRPEDAAGDADGPAGTSGRDHE